MKKYFYPPPIARRRYSCKLILLIILMFMLIQQSLFSQIPAFDLVERAQNLGNNRYYLTNIITPYDVAGAIWSQERIDLAKPYTFEFLANFGTDDEYGADGIVFVIHNDTRGNQAIGSSGAGIGYRAKWPYNVRTNYPEEHKFIQPCFAIEFDTWYNNFNGDPQYGSFQVDHISFNYFNASDPQGTLDANNPLIGNDDYPDPPQPPFVSAKKCTVLDEYNNIEDGQNHCIKIKWEPNPPSPVQGKGRITAYFDGDYRNSIDIDLINLVGDNTGQAFWGLTSANDDGQNNFEVTFENFTKCKLWVRPNIEICEGDAVELTTSAIGYDMQNVQYTWTPAIGLSDIHAPSPIARPRITTEYHVKMTTTDNCTSEAAVTVTVNSRPSTAIVKEFGRYYMNGGNQVNVQDMVYGTKKMADCNFLLSCQTDLADRNNGNKTYGLTPFLIKIRQDGTREWQKMYIYADNNDGSHIGCARYTTNAFEVDISNYSYNTNCDNTLNSTLFPDLLKHVGYAVICEADNPGYSREMLIFTINQDGSIRNKISFNAYPNFCNGVHMEATKDAGFIALGVSGTSSPTWRSIVAVKMKPDLTPEFNLVEIKYPNKFVDGKKIIECSDGSGFIVIGEVAERFENNFIDRNIFALKLKAAANQLEGFDVEWAYRYDCPTINETGTSILESYNASGQLEYFISGYGWDTGTYGDYDGFLLNINNMGVMNYAKKIGNSNINEKCWSIVENTTDSLGLLLNTNSNSQNPTYDDVVLMKIPKPQLQTYTGIVTSQQQYGDNTIPEDAYFLTSLGFGDYATAAETFWGNQTTSNIRFITTNSYISLCAAQPEIQINNAIVTQSSIGEYTKYWHTSSEPDITIVNATVTENPICSTEVCTCSDIAWFGQEAYNIKYTINQINSYEDKCCFDIRVEFDNSKPQPNCPFKKLDILITSSGEKINNLPLENFEGTGAEDFCINKNLFDISGSVNITFRYMDAGGNIICENNLWLNCNGVINSIKKEIGR